MSKFLLRLDVMVFLGDMDFVVLLLSGGREPEAVAVSERPFFLFPVIVELDEVDTLELRDCFDFPRLHP